MNETMNRLYKATEHTISADTYPGYPKERLVLRDARERSDLTLPDGPWTTRVMPFPSESEQQSLIEKGCELDAYGRPLHPWLRDMLQNPNVGVVTGTGEYYNWGPNYTADPIVLTAESVPKVLLIKRGDTGKWALPGGFVDEGETAINAAKRELFEEAGVLLGDSDGTHIYSGVVADLRTTAHAWAETTAILWRVDTELPVGGHDDAVDAKWFSSDSLPDELHGSHAVLIDLALKYDQPLETTHGLSIPEAVSYRIANGGHMAYRRIIATHHDGTETFIKSHDKHVFTDPLRAEHSKLYLQKEHHIYSHLRRSDFLFIPENITLHSDHTISMQALSESKGWHWRAPASHIDEYISSAFAAIDSLVATVAPEDFNDTETPIHEIIVSDGWDIVTDDSVERIQQQLTKCHHKLRPDFQAIIHPFISDIPYLHQQFRTYSHSNFDSLCHHDMRQANIAWHPQHGAKFVDWSWAGIGTKNSDTTMLLIDLHKSGHDVSDFMNRFDPQYARTLMGFWLAHGIMPAGDSEGVRFHQLVSALSSYDLLTKYR